MHHQHTQPYKIHAFGKWNSSGLITPAKCSSTRCHGLHKNGLTADHFPMAGKQHLPFARLGQLHKPWCGHRVLCSLRHWPFSIPQGHVVRMQSFCHSQLQGPRARNCLLSQLGNLWKNGKVLTRCSWHSRVNNGYSVYPGSQPLITHRWDTILSTTLSGTRRAVEGEITAGKSHNLPSSLPLLIALCPTHPPVLEIPIRHLPISPHPHSCRLGTGLSFSAGSQFMLWMEDKSCSPAQEAARSVSRRAAHPGLP